MKYKLQNSHEIIKHIIFLELGPLYQENDDFQQKLNALAYIRNMENGTAFLSENNNGNTVDASFVISIIGAIIYSIHFIDSILLTFGRHFGKSNLFLISNIEDGLYYFEGFIFINV